MAVLFTVPPNPVNWTKNPIVMTITYFGITAGWKLELRLRDTTTGVVIATVNLPFPALAGTINYDIKALCDPWPSLQQMLNLQVANSNLNQSISLQSRQVFVDMRPIGTGAPASYTTSSNFYVIKGGIGDMNLYDGYVNSNPFNATNFLPGGNRFLTWVPSGRNMTRDEWGWLAYLSTQDGGVQAVTYKVYYLNNTNATISVNLTGSGASGNLWKMWLVPIGVTQAKLDPTNLGVHYVEVYVLQGVVLLSNIFKYFCDNRPYYKTQNIFYRNSMGGIDHINLKGEIGRGYSTEKQEAQVVDYQPMYLSRARPKFKGNTGWITEAHMKALYELVNSTECYMLHGEKLLKVRVPQQELSWSNKDNLYSAKIEIEAAGEFEVFPRQLSTM